VLDDGKDPCPGISSRTLGTPIGQDDEVGCGVEFGGRPPRGGAVQRELKQGREGGRERKNRSERSGGRARRSRGNALPVNLRDVRHRDGVDGGREGRWDRGNAATVVSAAGVAGKKPRAGREDEGCSGRHAPKRYFAINRRGRAMRATGRCTSAGPKNKSGTTSRSGNEK
jgi:hypothetical protein